MRAGTLAVHNIVGFGKAAELAIVNEQQQTAYIQKLEQAAKKIIASNDHLELFRKSGASPAGCNQFGGKPG